MSEATKTADLIGQLLTAGVEISPTDIGVIAPYRQQVIRLRQILRARDLGQVNVGCVSNNFKSS